MASKGSYSAARFYNIQNKNLLHRAAKTEDQQRKAKVWSTHAKAFEDEMSTVQQEEAKQGYNDLDDNANDEEEAATEEDNVQEKSKSSSLFGLFSSSAKPKPAAAKKEMNSKVMLDTMLISSRRKILIS